MQKTNNTQYFSKLLPDPNIITASGVIGRVHKYKSNLLGLPENVPNNGTLGLMDGILTHPPFRPAEFRLPLLECFNVGFPVASGCYGCSPEELGRISAKLACALPKQTPFQISSTTPRCIQNYCEKTVIVGGGSEFSKIWTIEIPWKSKFVTDVLEPLNDYTQSLVGRMGRLISITGTAFDFDYDGIADEMSRKEQHR
ncbi:hypothetical protein TELCIR_13348 [Teladorsagia circumcincta]|uniref:Uncharacterized protein n=1 Tax=Teladorsagia circumcincta TaxID=45464 RepID=A0A2G9U647_TELCI|nr:hypothetical protein TELCIR_13348 [Teladorsagia circumcincta]